MPHADPLSALSAIAIQPRRAGTLPTTTAPAAEVRGVA